MGSQTSSTMGNRIDRLLSKNCKVKKDNNQNHNVQEWNCVFYGFSFVVSYDSEQYIFDAKIKQITKEPGKIKLKIDTKLRELEIANINRGYLMVGGKNRLVTGTQAKEIIEKLIKIIKPTKIKLDDSASVGCMLSVHNNVLQLIIKIIYNFYK